MGPPHEGSFPRESDTREKQAESVMGFNELASEVTYSRFCNSFLDPRVSPIQYERRPDKGVTTRSWGFLGTTSMGNPSEDKPWSTEFQGSKHSDSEADSSIGFHEAFTGAFQWWRVGWVWCRTGLVPTFPWGKGHEG